MSTLGMFSTLEGYHEYIGGCSVHRGDIMVDVGEQVGENLSISPDVLMVSPDVLMVSPTCIMISPDVLNIPHMHHDIPLMYS